MFGTQALRRLTPVALLAASAFVLASCGSDNGKDRTSGAASS
jgi:hypothetical protein